MFRRDGDGDHDHCQKCTFGYTCDSCKEWEISCGRRQPEYTDEVSIGRYENHDDSCPLCGSEMILKNRKDGTAQFFGCSKFPECRGSRNFYE